MYPSNTFRYLYLPWFSGIAIMLVLLILQTGTGEIPASSVPVNGATDDVLFKEKHPEVVITSTPPYLLCCRQKNEQKKVACSNERLMDYIYDHTAYPAGKPIHKTAGIVVADFVISPSGTIRDIRLIRVPKRDQGKDVVRILSEMEANGIRWQPATLNGQPAGQRMAVTIQYNMVWAGAKPQP